MSAPGTFGRYRIDSLLGKGGMGTVFRAFDTRLQRAVALKVLQNVEIEGDDLATRSAGVQRLIAEARAAAAIDHPNVVTVYDVGEEGGTPFVAMQLLEGHPLREFIGRPSPDLAARVRWLVQIGEGLVAAHRLGIVHRDIKPENVLVTHAGIKVLDFGIAKRLNDGGNPSLRPMPTVPGFAMGTPGYMAPEQRMGHPTDTRTDQFQWGVVAYELLTGRLPAQPPIPIAALVPGLSPELADAIDRALSLAPEARFLSMDALLRALHGGASPQSVLQSSPAAAAHMGPPTSGAPPSWQMGPPPPGASPSWAPTSRSAPPGGPHPSQVPAWAPTTPSAPPVVTPPPVPPSASAPPQPYQPTLASRHAPPLPAPAPAPSSGALAIVAVLIGVFAAVAIVGGLGLWLYTRRASTVDADAAAATGPAADAAPGALAPATAADAASPRVAPAVHHDASAPIAANDAGPPRDAAAAPQHVHNVVGNSPSYTFAELDRVLSAQHKALDHCLVGERVLPTDTLGFNLTVRQNGTVSHVQPRTAARPVAACMAQSLGGLVFPPLKNNLQVTNVSVSVFVSD